MHNLKKYLQRMWRYLEKEHAGDKDGRMENGLSKWEGKLWMNAPKSAKPQQDALHLIFREKLLENMTVFYLAIRMFYLLVLLQQNVISSKVQSQLLSRLKIHLLRSDKDLIPKVVIIFVKSTYKTLKM